MNAESQSPSTILFVHGATGPSLDIIHKLENKGYQVSCTPSVGIAREMIREIPLSGIIADFDLSEGTALDVLCFLRKVNSAPFIVIYENEGEVQTSVDGFLNCLSLKRPVSLDELIAGLVNLSGSYEKDQDLSQKIDFLSSSEKFIAVELEIFLSGSQLPYDVFIRLGDDRFIRIAKDSDGFSEGQLKKLEARGVRCLYLKRGDFYDYMSKNVGFIRHLGETSIDAGRKGLFIKQTVRLLSEKFIGRELGHEGICHAKDIIDATLEIVTGSGALLMSLELLKNSRGDIYAHSLNVSLFSVLIAKKMNWNSPSTLMKLSLAGLFHDVGKTALPEAVTGLTASELNHSEAEMLRDHVEAGVKLLRKTGALDQEILTIIAQHHEQENGKGFPAQLRKNKICPLAKVVHVADDFCQLMLEKQQNMNGIHEAIRHMEKNSDISYDGNCIRALRSIFNRKANIA